MIKTNKSLLTICLSIAVALTMVSAMSFAGIPGLTDESSNVYASEKTTVDNADKSLTFSDKDKTDLKGAVRSDDRIAGKLTIAGYPGSLARLMPHGFLTFTTYENVDLNISYYAYYKPTKKYADLMRDYVDNPEMYSSDPALYNKNDLGISDRDTYFQRLINGVYSNAEKVSLKAGESINIENSAYDPFNLESVIYVLANSEIASTEEAKQFIEELQYFLDRDTSFRLRKALAGGIKTFIKAYKEAIATGHNPVDGKFKYGGLMINKVLHDQFTGNVSRLPNNYYSVEITASELAKLKKCISDPSNNFFSFLDRNCTATAVLMWNAALSDRPELNLNANYTGFAKEPYSLYVELGLLRHAEGLDGEGGRNFSPRTLADKVVKKANPLKVTAKTAAVKYSKLKKKAQTVKRSNVLTVKNAKGTVTYKKLSGKAKITINKKTGKVTVKKGLKKGTYKVKVKVSAAGNSQYKAGSKTATFRITVK